MKTSDRVYPVVSLLFVLVFGQLLSSCKQNSNPTDVQPGSVTGVASLWDSVGPMASSAGVTVVLENSNYTTQTDATGFWKIDNVSPGNYNITVSKSGFGLCKAYGVTVEGPGTASVTPTMIFEAAPTDVPAISNMTIHQGDTGSLTSVLGAISVSNNNSSIMPVIFMDLSPNVQPGDAHKLFQLWRAYEYTSNQFGWSVDAIHQAGIPSGTTVYISASEVNFASVWHPGGEAISSGSYTDPVDNSIHFITTGPRSNVVAVTIP